MKFGFRKPSLKKSISAMTTGQLNRSLKRMILPGYGKGYYTSWKKGVYNRAYSLTTIDLFNIIFGKRICKERHQKTKQIEYYENRVKRCRQEYENSVARLKELDTRVASINANINECHHIIKFVKIIKNDVVSNKSLLKAIDRVESYILRYIDSSFPKKENVYLFLDRELSKLKENATKDTTKYECEIGLVILNQIKSKITIDKILEEIKSKYEDLYLLPQSKPKSKPIIFPNELLSNPNNYKDGESQLAIFRELSHKISMTKFTKTGTTINPIYQIHINLLNLVVSYEKVRKKKININLYDFLEFKLSERLNTIKRPHTIKEYKIALNIVSALKCNISNDFILVNLKDNIYEFKH